MLLPFLFPPLDGLRLDDGGVAVEVALALEDHGLDLGGLASLGLGLGLVLLVGALDERYMARSVVGVHWLVLMASAHIHTVRTHRLTRQREQVDLLGISENGQVAELKLGTSARSTRVVCGRLELFDTFFRMVERTRWSIHFS